MAGQIPGIVWATDTDLRFTASFGAGLAALGLHPSEVIGKTLFDYFQTANAAFPPIAAHARALLGEAVDFEQIWQDRIFRCHLEQLHDDNGSVIGCVGFALT
jgi:PAS domain-containing protein